MRLHLLDFTHGSLAPHATSPSGLLLGALLVLAVAAITVTAANALARKSPAAPTIGNSSQESRDDTWPPPPRR